mmetsp:Transcript_47142/g.87588  ORF Transcript_47142/g.87588 Transcript_47142/m.87588 type:complete len:84 (-) Transcript_47142:23-274(-)
MKISDGAEHLLDEPNALLFGEKFRFLVEAIQELTSKTQLLDEVHLGSILVNFNKASNVRMVEFAHYADFLADAFESLIGPYLL